jgi:hypothetical protein
VTPPSTRAVNNAIKLRTQEALCQVLEQLTLDARTAGLFVTARALTNAKNACGWEAAGDLIAAGVAARGDRPNESRGRDR